MRRDIDINCSPHSQAGRCASGRTCVNFAVGNVIDVCDISTIKKQNLLLYLW